MDITPRNVFDQTVNALSQSEVITLLKEELHQMKRDWLVTYLAFNPANYEYLLEQDYEYYKRLTYWVTKFHLIFDCMGVHHFGKIYIYEYITYNFISFINAVMTRFDFLNEHDFFR